MPQKFPEKDPTRISRKIICSILVSKRFLPSKHSIRWEEPQLNPPNLQKHLKSPELEKKNTNLMALTIPTHFKFKPLNLQHQKSQTHLEFIRVRSTRNYSIGSYFSTHHRIVLTRVCSDGGRETRVGPQQPMPYVSSKLAITLSGFHLFHFPNVVFIRVCM